MLNFKVGKTYKDNSGREWEFVSYAPGRHYPYFFKEKETNAVYGFCEQEGNIVTERLDAGGTKIPFVEEQEKERDWVIGEEYECFDAATQSVVMAHLTKIIKETGSHLFYMFNINGISCGFHDEGIVLVMGRFVVFKDGIPQELKDRLNKSKLTNKQRHFQKGRVYKDDKNENFTFIKRIKATRGVFGIFESNNDKGLYILILRKINNVECITCREKFVFCADESIRNENASKAVRVMQ